MTESLKALSLSVTGANLLGPVLGAMPSLLIKPELRKLPPAETLLSPPKKALKKISLTKLPPDWGVFTPDMALTPLASRDNTSGTIDRP